MKTNTAKKKIGTSIGAKIRVIKSESSQIKSPKPSKRELAIAKLAKRSKMLVKTLEQLSTWGVRADEVLPNINRDLQIVLETLKALPVNWTPPRKGKLCPVVGGRAWVRPKYLADYSDVLDASQPVIIAKIGKRLLTVSQEDVKVVLPAAHLTVREPAQ